MKDVAHAYLSLGENLEKLHLAGEAFKFSSGSQVSVLDVMYKIVEIMDQKDFPIQILNEAKGEMKDQYLSIEKARKVLNWSPQYSLQDGLRETVEWYREFFNGN